MHIPVLSSFEDVIIDSAAEIDTERGKKAADKFGIPNYYGDYQEMYEKSDLDGVFVCLPNFLHYESVNKALKNDLNVFCEKPMGLTAHEASKLVEIAQAKDLVLGVGYNRRLDKTYEQAAEMVKGHRLGKLLQINGVLMNTGPYGGWVPSSDWFFNDKCGVLYDSGPHLMDLMMYILSDKIVEVFAEGVSTMYEIDVFDNIVGTFRTEKGVLGSFNIGWRAGADFDAVQVHGTGCSVVADPMEIKSKHGMYGPLDKISDNLNSTKAIARSFIGKTTRGIPVSETFFHEDRKFLDAILNKGKLAASGEDALNTLRVLEAVKQSLQDKKSVVVKE